MKSQANFVKHGKYLTVPRTKEWQELADLWGSLFEGAWDGNAAVWKELLEEIHDLPIEQVREILDFATFLRQKLQHGEARLQAEREEAADRMDERQKRIGPVDIRAADLVEEGRATRVAEVLQE